MSLADQMYESIPQWDQAKVRNAKVLVIGAGALGNEVLKNLALLNVRRLVIVDFDQVETSNLTRSVLFRQSDADQHLYKVDVAAERLLEINPELQILTLKGDVVTDLSLGLLALVDVVIGCLDNRLARLYLNRLCWRAGKPWIDGGILNLSGQVSVYMPGASCYECGLSPLAWSEIRRRLGCTDMARRYAMEGQAVTTPLAASIIGAIQVQEALKFVLGLHEQVLTGKMFSYEGSHHQAAVYEFHPIRESCESHYQPSQVVDIPLSADSTLDEFLDFLESSLGFGQPCLQLDHSIALRLTSIETGSGEAVILPLPHFSDRISQAFSEIHGGRMGVPKGAMLEELHRGLGLGHLHLSDFGIPYGHVVRVGRSEHRCFVGLEKDQSRFEFSVGIRQLENPWWDRKPDQIRLVYREDLIQQ